GPRLNPKRDDKAPLGRTRPGPTTSARRWTLLAPEIPDPVRGAKPWSGRPRPRWHRDLREFPVTLVVVCADSPTVREDGCEYERAATNSLSGCERPSQGSRRGA